jgi:hypothetical protein
MGRITQALVVCLAVIASPLAADEFPVMVYYHPADEDASGDLIAKYDSLLVSIGVTHYLDGRSPEKTAEMLDSARSSGLEVILVGPPVVDLIITDSASFEAQPVDSTLENLCEKGMYWFSRNWNIVERKLVG